MSTQKTAERVSHLDKSDNYVFQRSLFAYEKAAGLISGNVLELGTGSAYGITVLAPHCEYFLTLDKFDTALPQGEEYQHVEFRQINFPPLHDLKDNTFDYVITFQVIEHIVNDVAFISEIHRVLKHSGKLIVTTPNRLTTLTRNPWHIREYTIEELKNILGNKFHSIETNGVFGNDKVMDYYEKNKQSVEKIMRWDFLNLQYRLPRQLLQIPYDFMNRLNRKKLLRDNNALVNQIKMEDFYLQSATDDCLDLFFIAEKGV